LNEKTKGEAWAGGKAGSPEGERKSEERHTQEAVRCVRWSCIFEERERKRW
jgi:hypothetical protein